MEPWPWPGWSWIIPDGLCYGRWKFSWNTLTWLNLSVSTDGWFGSRDVLSFSILHTTRCCMKPALSYCILLGPVDLANEIWPVQESGFLHWSPRCAQSIRHKAQWAHIPPWGWGQSAVPSLIQDFQSQGLYHYKRCPKTNRFQCSGMVRESRYYMEWNIYWCTFPKVDIARSPDWIDRLPLGE